jgi:HEAT repeat protein
VPLFIRLLDDPDTQRVRREAPEILRVIGKRQPEIVECAIPKLVEKLSDEDKVLRIHAQGALDAIRKSSKLVLP